MIGICLAAMDSDDERKDFTELYEKYNQDVFRVSYKIPLTPYADTGVSSTFPVSMSKAVTVFPVSFRQRMVRRPLFFAIPL